MCGRYTLTSSPQALAQHFELEELPELAPRFNIAPSQSVPVVRAESSARRTLAMLRWGLVPAWAKDAAIGNRLINARSETAADKPAYRDALRRRRCLVPMDGFYEWQRGGPRAGPRWFHAPDGAVLGVAGLWESWRGGDGGELHSCTILTTQANARVAAVHDRMPVILDPADYTRWLDPDEQRPESVLPLLVACADERLAVRPVSPRVNDVRTDDASCLEPPPPPAQGELFGS